MLTWSDNVCKSILTKMHIYTFRCSGIGCWGDSFNYMVMVKAFQIKPYQEHNQNETACMKYSEMIQLIKNIWIQISWYSLQQQK